MASDGVATIGAMVIIFADSGSSIAGDNNPVNVLSNSGQMISAWASPIPGATIAVAPAAATMTFMKITVDVAHGEQISPGDILSIAGNVVGIVGAVGVLAGATGIAIPAAMIGLALGALGALGNMPFGKDNIIPLSELSRDGDLFTRTPWLKAVSNILGTMPDPLVKTIKYIPYVDPLILDLDGDGLEITRLRGSASVKFDTDGDDIKTATAWAAADDGLLVWDRNGNGTIDSGAELFGDETVLAGGAKAAHGFAALAELDSNHDGSFDAADAQFASLRVWRDLNQDGISQAAELKTLADSGVKAIGLTSTAASTPYGDALLVQSGGFTRSDGTSGQAGSFLLAQDSFVREFVPITVSPAARALPNLGGSGWVRDLQEAATLAPELIERVAAARNAPTRAGYAAAVAGSQRGRRRGRPRPMDRCSADVRSVRIGQLDYWQHMCLLFNYRNDEPARSCLTLHWSAQWRSCA